MTSVIHRSQRHDLLKRGITRSEQHQQFRGNVRQLEAAQHVKLGDTELAGDSRSRLPFICHDPVGVEFIGRVHGFLRDILSKADLAGPLLGNQLAFDQRISLDPALAGQPLQGAQSAPTGLHSVPPSGLPLGDFLGHLQGTQLPLSLEH